MKASLPTGLWGQIMALCLTFLVMSLTWLTLAMPLIEWHAERASRLEGRAGLVRRMDALVASLPVLEARLAAPASNGIAVAGALLPGATDAIAGADLQQHVQEMAARAGLTLASSEMLPTTAAGGYRRIGLRIAASATWPVLVALLRSIDQTSPRMLVDDLQVRGPGMVMKEEPVMQISFTVHAFRRDATPADRR